MRVVYASTNATITLSGQGTTIQGNGTKGSSKYYGLNAAYYSSTIHLVHPLTKEQISTKNGGGGNCGGDGTIEQIGGPPGETKSDVTTPSVSLILFFSLKFLGRLVLLLVLLMVVISDFAFFF